jgi:leader peptidase (prepilin peptidase)/N-methyltransferase
VVELPASLVPLAAVWCAAVGAVVGSFLNVVIARVPAGESIVHPGSRCPRCAAPIRWYDNVPVLSWLLLRARCRRCGAPISARYPLVELLGAGAALLAFFRHGLSAAAAAELAFAAFLVALAWIDLDTWLLPHGLTWPLLGLGLVASALGLTDAGALRPALYGAGFGFLALATVAFVGERVFKKEAMGFGDVWLLAALGAWLGPRALLPVVLLASLQGAVIGIALLLAGRGEPGPPAPPSPPLVPSAGPQGGPESVDAPPSDDDAWVPPRHAVPFGPFLAAAALEWLYLGDLIARAVPGLRIFR